MNKNMFRKFYFMLLKDRYSRANYLRKHDILASIGKNVYFYSRIFPADPKLLKIGNNVFIGADSVILPGVKISDDTIIGAGAVVTKDLPAGLIWGGTCQKYRKI